MKANPQRVPFLGLSGGGSSPIHDTHSKNTCGCTLVGNTATLVEMYHRDARVVSVFFCWAKIPTIASSAFLKLRPFRRGRPSVTTTDSIVRCVVMCQSGKRGTSLFAYLVYNGFPPSKFHHFRLKSQNNQERGGWNKILKKPIADSERCHVCSRLA